MAFDIKEDQVPAALDAMRLFKMRGCNVTMPCKNKVAQCVDELSPVSYTHLRAHETRHDLVCRLLLEKKKIRQHVCRLML